MTKNEVLIIEDALPTAMIYERYLKGSGYSIKIVQTGQDGLRVIKRDNPDVVLLDLNLPDINGEDILKELATQGIKSNIIVISAQTALDKAISTMQNGAIDYIVKPIDPERLKITVANAMERKKLENMLTYYQDSERNNFCSFIGGSPEMRAAYHMIENASKSNASVMIMGESGTGKELAAQAVHALSLRKNESIISLNCAAIPADLLESEIFGHVKGAFTGATADRDGAAKLAHNGTLFLDELTEMPIHLQSKLLRFIQTGAYSPVGSSKVLQSNIRFVSATNRNPLQAIEAGTLREDLYYRLAVIPISLPPLRARGDDIIILAQHFLEKYSKEEGKSFISFSKSVKETLKSYSWPGNVRELQNAIRRVVIMNIGDIVNDDMIAPVIQGGLTAVKERELAPVNWNNVFEHMEDIIPFEEIEKSIISSAIRVCGNNMSEAGRRLKISSSTLYRRYDQWKSE